MSKHSRRYDGWSLEARDPKAIASIMPVWEWFYRYYFRASSDGWEHVPEDPVLFVGSHNGGLAAPDMTVTMYDWFRRFGSDRPVYGLMHPNVWHGYSGTARFVTRLGAVRAHPKMALAAFRQGASVLVYPGGAQDVYRPHHWRDRIYFAGRRGFIKLALRSGVPIVPVISYGAHDTLIVLADCYDLVKFLHEEWGMPWLFDLDPEVFPIYLGLPWGLTFGPVPNFPLPTHIHVRACPPIRFKYYGRKAASDRDYVEQCFQGVRRHMQAQMTRLYREKEG